MEQVKKHTGFVALIDVLGFRELVGRPNELEAIRSYVENIVGILDNGTFGDSLNFVLFSDSLVIDTPSDTVEGFSHLVRACAFIFYALAERQIAIRGAISHGSFIRGPTEKRGVIIAGRPVVEANQYEHFQDWVGIMLAPSVVRRLDSALRDGMKLSRYQRPEATEDWRRRNRVGLYVQRYKAIPFHASTPSDFNSYDGYAIVPIRPQADDPYEYLRSVIDAKALMERMWFVAPDPKSQRKYKNTLEWLEEVRGSWTTQGLASNVP